MQIDRQNPSSKVCDRCQKASPLLYRIQQDSSQSWIFVCPECWQLCNQDNPHYRYGGTWKQRKKSR